MCIQWEIVIVSKYEDGLLLYSLDIFYFEPAL